MEPPESLTGAEPVVPERTIFSALSDWILLPIMNIFMEYFWGEWKLGLYVGAAVAVVGTIKLLLHITRQNRRKKWNAVGKDMVVVHTDPPAKFTPTRAVFSLKLETYLRMSEIPYVLDTAEPIGPKGKLPWITLNGESIADSQLIIEKLGQKFDKDFSSHLTPDQKGVAQAMRIMIEEHFFWCFFYWFVIVDDCRTFVKLAESPLILRFCLTLWLPIGKRDIKSRCKVQGLGRHTDKEIEEMGKKDIIALSTYLGNKSFLMGDKPTEVDCTIFAFLAQIVWNYPDSPYGIMLKTDCTNLTDYCHRMKEQIWPDWNQCLDPPQPILSSEQK